MNDDKDENEDNVEEVTELIINNSPEDVKEILEIAEEHDLDIETAEKVKEFADEEGLNTDEVAEFADEL
jgi:hypothetical protein